MQECQFKHRTKDDYPIIRACKQNNIDFMRFKQFMDDYAWFIDMGIASEALQLHKSREWQEITNTAQALNEGQNCFATFVKRFYMELNQYQPTETDIVNE